MASTAETIKTSTPEMWDRRIEGLVNKLRDQNPLLNPEVNQKAKLLGMSSQYPQLIENGTTDIASATRGLFRGWHDEWFQRQLKAGIIRPPTPEEVSGERIFIDTDPDYEGNPLTKLLGLEGNRDYHNEYKGRSEISASTGDGLLSKYKLEILDRLGLPTDARISMPSIYQAAALCRSKIFPPGQPIITRDTDDMGRRLVIIPTIDLPEISYTETVAGVKGSMLRVVISAPELL